MPLDLFSARDECLSFSVPARAGGARISTMHRAACGEGRQYLCATAVPGSQRGARDGTSSCHGQYPAHAEQHAAVRTARAHGPRHALLQSPDFEGRLLPSNTMIGVTL